MEKFKVGLLFFVFLTILVINETIKKTEIEKTKNEIQKRIFDIKCKGSFEINDAEIVSEIKKKIKKNPEYIEIAGNSFLVLYELETEKETIYVLEYSLNEEIEQVLELSFQKNERLSKKM